MVNRQNRRTPTIVVSAPRSGSTWLAGILEKHRELSVYRHDTAILYSVYPLKTLNPFTDDAPVKVTSNAVLTQFRMFLIRKYYSASENLVLVSPTNAVFLPLLTTVFPDARYIHLRRDPLDVAASLRNFLHTRGATLKERYQASRDRGHVYAGKMVLRHIYHSLRWYTFSHAGYLGARPAGFQEAASLPLLQFLSWYHNAIEVEIQNVLADIPVHSKYELKYERLVRRHKQELSALLEFLGVAVPQDYLQFTSASIRPDTIGSYHRRFSDDELKSVRDYLMEYDP